MFRLDVLVLFLQVTFLAGSDDLRDARAHLFGTSFYNVSDRHFGWFMVDCMVSTSSTSMTSACDHKPN